MTGFKGELVRFAGDAAKQNAEACASAIGPEAVVGTRQDLKCKGISPCYVVFKSMTACLDARCQLV